MHKVQQQSLSLKMLNQQMNKSTCLSSFHAEKNDRLNSIGKTVKDLNKLNTFLMKYGACIYMVEDTDNGLRYRWKFHNYVLNLYMWVSDVMLDDIMARRNYHVIVMRQAEKYFLEHPKCKKYKHE